MRKFFSFSAPPTLAITVTAAFFLFLSACEKDKAIAGKIPDLAVKDYSGQPVKVDFSSNQTTLLVFWATWCQPCIMEIPALMMLHEKYRDRNFQVISINVDDPEGKKVAAYANQFGINYPLLSGDDKAMQRFGGITALPTSFLLDREGRIIEKIQGLLHEAELERRVLAALNAKI